MEKIDQILEKLLHAETAEGKTKALPQELRECFETRTLFVNGMEILFAKPKGRMTFGNLQKQWGELAEQSDSYCALYLEEWTRYSRERMIEQGIPFVLGEDNLYLPFLAVVLSKRRAGKLPRITKFTPAAQKMILLAIYQNWREVSSREISENMGVSRMTASRNLLELQALGLPLVEERKGTKYFSFFGNRRQLLELCQPYFDNPVSRICILEEIPRGADCLGGRSAVSRYSMMTDHPYRTYALTREEYRELEIDRYELCDLKEAACVIQVLRYKIKTEKMIDPISAALSVLGNESCTPREEAALKKVMLDSVRQTIA